MKLKLNINEIFWSLIDPSDVEKVGVILNSNAPEAEINYDKLPQWAKEQIINSEKAKVICTTPKATLQAIKKSDTTVSKKTKKKTKKKTTRSKKKTKKAVVIQDNK